MPNEQPSTSVEHITSRGITEHVTVNDDTRELSRRAVPSRGIISRFTDGYGRWRTERNKQYERHIAVASEVPEDQVTDLYIQFGGAGASADSQAGLMKDICRNTTAEDRHVMAMSVESVSNPEARGPVAPASLERILVNVELILKRLKEMPNTERIFLSFRSMSALEAAQTALMLNEKFKELQEHMDGKAEGKVPAVEGLFLFQAGQVIEQSLKEFYEGGMKLVMSKEREIHQLFPDIEDFGRVSDAIDRAKESQDVGEERRNTELLEQMKMLNPMLRLAILEEKRDYVEKKLEGLRRDEILLGTSRPEDTEKRKEQTPVKRLEQELETIDAEIREARDLEQALVIFGDDGKDVAVKEQLYAIEKKLWSLFPPQDKNVKKEYEELKKKRQKLLRPAIDAFLAGGSNIPAEDKPKADKRGEAIRLFATLLPHFNIIRKMPQELRQKLIDARIPISYVFADRDSAFPVDKLLKDLRLTRGSLEEIVVLFGNHPHSTLGPVNEEMSKAIATVMERARKMKRGVIEQNPERRIVLNTQGSLIEKTLKTREA